METYNLCKERLVCGFSARAADAWPYLYLICDLECALRDRSTDHAADKFLHGDSGLVHIEGSDHKHPRRLRRVAGGRGDVLLNRVEEQIGIHIMLSGDRDNRSAISDRTLDKVEYLPVAFQGPILIDQIDLILDDHDVLDAHYLYSCQMLPRLWLRTRLVSGDYEDDAIHDCRPAEHRSHQSLMSRGVNKTDSSYKDALGAASGALLPCGVIVGRLTVRTLIDGRICVAEFYRDAPLQLFTVPCSPDSGEGFNQRCLSMIDVADCADVELGLTRQLWAAWHLITDPLTEETIQHTTIVG